MRRAYICRIVVVSYCRTEPLLLNGCTVSFMCNIIIGGRYADILMIGAFIFSLLSRGERFCGVA